MIYFSPYKNDVGFVGRQLSTLVRQRCTTPEAAIDEIHRASNNEFSIAVQTVNDLLKGESSFKENPYALLADIFSIQRPDIAEISEIITYYNCVSEKFREDVKMYLFSLRNTFAYLSLLLAVTVFMMLINMTKVLPTFTEMFVGLGESLPEFTGYIIGPGKYFIAVTLLFIGIVLYGAFFGALRINRSIELLRVIPNSSIVGLLAKNTVQTVNANVVLIQLSILVRCGRTFDQALKDCQALMKMKRPSNIEMYFSSDLYSKLAISAKLNTVQSEIDHQLTYLSEQLIHQLVRFRTAISITLQILMITVIGALVIAYYLPIFKMGSVV